MLSDWLGPFALFVVLAALFVRLWLNLRAADSQASQTIFPVVIELDANSSGGMTVDFLRRRLEAFPLARDFTLRFADEERDDDLAATERVIISLSGDSCAVRLPERGVIVGDPGGYGLWLPDVPIAFSSDEAHAEFVRLVVFCAQVDHYLSSGEPAHGALRSALSDAMQKRLREAQAVGLTGQAGALRDYLCAWLMGASGFILNARDALARARDAMDEISLDEAVQAAFSREMGELEAHIALYRCRLHVAALDAPTIALDACRRAQSLWSQRVNSADDDPSALASLRAALLCESLVVLQSEKPGEEAGAQDMLEDLLALGDQEAQEAQTLLDCQASTLASKRLLEEGRRDALVHARRAVHLAGWWGHGAHIDLPFSETGTSIVLSAIDHMIETVWRLHEQRYDVGDIHAVGELVDARARLVGHDLSATAAEACVGILSILGERDGDVARFSRAQTINRTFRRPDPDAGFDVLSLKIWAGILDFTSQRSERHLASVRVRDLLSKAPADGEGDVVAVVAQASRSLATYSDDPADIEQAIELTERWALNQPTDPTALEMLGALNREAADAIPAKRDAFLRAGAQSYERVGACFDRSRDPLSWSMARLERGSLLLDLARARGDVDGVKEAINCFRDAETVFGLKRVPRQRLDALMKLGESFVLLIAMADRSPGSPCKPDDAKRSALTYLEKAHDLSVLPELSHMRETCRRRLQAAQRVRASEG